MKSNLIALLWLTLCFVSCNTQTKDSSPQDPLLAKQVMCGTVEFTDGCGERTDSLIRYGLALIHHMTYEEAEVTFDQVIKEDPDCFWGPWGKAMTYIHPLWPDVLTEEQLEMGYTLSQRALALAKKPKETLYGEALASFYVKDALSKAERIAAFQKGWASAHEQLPDDVEAELFNALFRLAQLSPADKSFAVNAEVGATAERLLVKYPDHPGGFHYGIHAYDVPPMANKALVLARNYGKLAPELPHALHMPSHIFTRLGYWKESIEWNARSAAAALKMPNMGKVSPHAFHAMDYMVYAHLQYGEDERAAAIVNSIDTITLPIFANPASAYAIAAMRSRLALESHDWKAAAQLPDPDTASFPWKKFPQYEGMVYYAKGIGAARSGQTDMAREYIQKMETLKSNLGTSPQTTYWLDQLDLQQQTVQAWITCAEGNKDLALNQILKAADMEDNTQKNPISPGELIPVREQAADMMMEMKKPKEALVHYQTNDRLRPNRFHTIHGIASSAEQTGDMDLARNYYQKLVDLKGSEGSKRKEYQHASDMLAAK